MRKLFSLLIIGVLVIVNFNLLKSSYESQKKLTQVSAQEKTVQALQDSNAKLKDELKQRDSSYFIEEEARNLLDYGRPGETTIVVQDQSLSSAENAAQKVPKSNFQKWFELLKL